MRSRTILAVILSLVLVIGASLTRLNKNSYNSATLTAVERPLASNEYEDLIKNYLENTPTSTSTPADLTNTDLIGRQLLTDYLNLNSAGQATDANINTL